MKSRNAVASELECEFFNGNLFSDPIWKLLIELFVSHSRKELRSDAELFDLIEASHELNAHNLQILCDLGVAARTVSSDDPQAAYVELTPSAYDALDNYFQASRD